MIFDYLLGSYHNLIDNFGYNRKDGYRPDIAPPNAFIGIYMRLDLLCRDKLIDKLFAECIDYFYPMAVRTGALWEHNVVPSAVAHDTDDYTVSCDHGFASYAATWITYALTGYNGIEFDDDFLGIDCKVYIPFAKAEVTVVNGIRKITHNSI